MVIPPFCYNARHDQGVSVLISRSIILRFCMWESTSRNTERDARDCKSSHN
jgi:hypothetical protein